MNDKLKKIIPVIAMLVLLVVAFLYSYITQIDRDPIIDYDPMPEKNNKLSQEDYLALTGTINGVDYTITNNNGANKGARSYQVLPCDCIDGPTNVFIYLGERTTGGYELIVKSIFIDDEKNVTIEVMESTPGFDEVVTQAFTYSSKSIKFETNINSVTIVDVEGREYSKID